MEHHRPLQGKLMLTPEIWRSERRGGGAEGRGGDVSFSGLHSTLEKYEGRVRASLVSKPSFDFGEVVGRGGEG